MTLPPHDPEAKRQAAIQAYLGFMRSLMGESGRSLHDSVVIDDVSRVETIDHFLAIYSEHCGERAHLLAEYARAELVPLRSDWRERLESGVTNAKLR